MSTLSGIKTEIIGADLSKVVDRVTKQYDRPDIAFQKEAIQNSWDVRVDKKDGKGWNLKIYAQKSNDGKTHIVVEDFGTKGMNEKRWGGFSSLWRPEKEQSSAGGKGQGKFVLMSASQEHILFVESISDDSSYRCKFLQNELKSADGENINISEHIPGAVALTHQGTKIWIYDVREDFLEILHSSEFTDSIIESWWQILGPRFQANINIFGKEVPSPALPTPVEEVLLLENYSLNGFGRIKRLHLGFYAEQLPDFFDGVRVQRANMMIVKVPFEVIDPEYRGRFSGYIEFDESLEGALKEIERNDHCNFLYDSPWKEIKALVKGEAEKFVAKIVPSKEKRKSINIRNLAEVIQKANQIIDEYCPEVLGGGTVMPPIIPKPKLPIRIKHFSINKREVKWGDTIKSACGVINDTANDAKVSLCVEVKKVGVKISEEEYTLKLKAGESKSIKLTEIKLDKSKFEKGKYLIRATLRDGHHDLDSKSTSFYLETKREPTKKGYIKEIRFYESDEPLRNKSVRGGVLEINLAHHDFANLWSLFEEKPTIQSRQIGFYVMKLCFDEATRELFKMRLKDYSPQAGDLDDIIQDIKETQDRMYHDIHG